MENADRPLVSVVTPFYNTDQYLAECIESVLRQTWSNFEYILVNNCSTDRSLQVAEYYASKDSRIRVVTNRSFLNQVQNYNHAVRQISPHSQYCKVVQADDWIFPECLEQMVEIAVRHPNVGVVGAYGLFGSDVLLYGLPIEAKILPGREICRKLLLDGLFVFGTPTSLLMRSDLVRKRAPFYNEASPFEDVEVCFELLQESDFAFVHQVLTYTRRDNDSLFNSIRPFGPMELMNVILARRYGPIFLTGEECQALMDAAERRYYRKIGEKVLRGTTKEFWEFHRKGLESVGCRLQWSRLLMAACWEIFDLLLNPKSTVERVLDLKTWKHP